MTLNTAEKNAEACLHVLDDQFLNALIIHTIIS